MRIIVIDSDMGFTNSLTARFKKANVFSQIFNQPTSGLAEIRKNPDGVDIVLIAKEQGGGQDGLAAVQQLRKDPKTVDVPYILLSSAWGKAEFAKHQKTEFGANAYFSKKSGLVELEDAIAAVTGFKFPSPIHPPKPAPSAAAKVDTGASTLNIRLQPAAEVVNIAEEVPDGIEVTAPINLFPDGEPPLGAEESAATSGISTGGVLTMPTMVAPDEESVAPAAGVVTERTKTGSLEISVGSADFQLETSGKMAFDSANLEISLTSMEPPQPEPAAEAPVAVDAEAAAQAAAISDMPVPEIPPQPVVSESPRPIEAHVPVSEEEAAKDLPYLFAGPSAMVVSSEGGGAPGSSRSGKTGFLLGRQPIAHLGTGRFELADAGGFSNDVATLKKYLMMREQDISVLTAQLSYAKEELSKSEDSIKRLTAQNEDFLHQVSELKQRVAGQDDELRHAGKSMEGEVEQLRFEVKSKIDRIKFLEEKLEDSALQYEKLKERVRLDIRKIRVRERELEAKLEILKKDSETLIGARENKILELKRKIDLLEFNYDTLQDKNELEKQNVRLAHEKIGRILKILKLATGVIESEDIQVSEDKVA